MDVEEKLRIVERGVLEVVTKEELKNLLEEKERPRAYVGYEPSGKIHLGHMISVTKLIELQNLGFDIVVLLADLHAFLNSKGSLEEIKETAEYNKHCFIGLGLDEKKTKFVYGSEFQLEKDYTLNLHRLALETTIRRARRSMDIVSREEEDPKVARVIYPLMQALDIAMLGIDVAIGGMDQRKIHMLARDNLPKIGFKAPICIHLPIIHGLDGSEKMSSSKGNFIAIDDDEETIRKKIKKAYCPFGVVENNPIIEIYEHIVFPRYEKIVVKRPEKYGGDVEFKSIEELKRSFENKEIHPQDLKDSLSDYLIKILSGAREYLASKGYV